MGRESLTRSQKLFDDGEAERLLEAHLAEERYADRMRKRVGVAVDIGRRSRSECVENRAADPDFAPLREIKSGDRVVHISGTTSDHQDQFEAVSDREISEVFSSF